MTLFSKDAMELQAMRSAWKEKCDLVESLRQQLAACERQRDKLKFDL